MSGEVRQAHRDIHDMRTDQAVGVLKALRSLDQESP